MKNNLFEKLKTLSVLAPDKEYANKSRHLILLSPQVKTSYDFAFLMKTGVAVSFAFLIMLGGLFVGRAVHERAMVVQANETNEQIQIRLNTIKYLLGDPARTSAEKAVKSAELLGRAVDKLKEANEHLASGNMGELLKNIIAAQKFIIEIEDMVRN